MGQIFFRPNFATTKQGKQSILSLLDFCIFGIISNNHFCIATKPPIIVSFIYACHKSQTISNIKFCFAKKMEKKLF